MPPLSNTWGMPSCPDDALVCRQVIEHIDFLDRSLPTLPADVTERLCPFEAAVTISCSIHGVSRTTAEVMIAEMGVARTRSRRRGTCADGPGWPWSVMSRPGSATLSESERSRQWLQFGFVDAARGASRNRGTFLSAQYSRLARGRGSNKVTIGVTHSILEI
jgi:transposase